MIKIFYISVALTPVCILEPARNLVINQKVVLISGKVVTARTGKGQMAFNFLPQKVVFVMKKFPGMRVVVLHLKTI